MARLIRKISKYRVKFRVGNEKKYKYVTIKARSNADAERQTHKDFRMMFPLLYKFEGLHDVDAKRMKTARHKRSR